MLDVPVPRKRRGAIQQTRRREMPGEKKGEIIKP